VPDAGGTVELPDGAAPNMDGALPGTDAAMDAAGDAGPTDGGADTGAPSDAADDGAPLDGGECTNITNVGALISQMDVATNRPAGSGGTLVDGTYTKSADTIYTGPGGATGMTGYQTRETLVVSNSASGTSSLLSVQDPVGSSTITERLTFQPTGGGMGILDFVCPSYGPSTVGYSVRNGATVQLDIFIGNDRIETFTKQ
jgi:hypothetical protein